jgi:hypothetical protein
MAEQSFPFENIDTTESQFSEWATNFQETGVQGSPTGTELGITVTGSDLNLTIAAGQAFIRGHYYINTDDLVLAVTSAGTNTRIDIVVVELDPEANTIVTKIVSGTAVASDPVAPTLTQSATGIYQLPISTLTIPTSTVAIIAGMLVDTRTFMGNRIGIWTTATRPANPTAYQTLGYNTTIGSHESWNGTAWVGFFDPITTEGDLVVGDATGQASRLGVGADEQVLTVVDGAPAWALGGSGGDYYQITATGTYTVALEAGLYQMVSTNPVTVGGVEVDNTFQIVNFENEITSIETPSGLTFNSRSPGFFTLSIKGLAYGNGIFVAVGQAGLLTTSTDGITWTSRTSGFGDSNINGVIYADSLFLAGGDAGKIATSTDGITWTSRTSGFGGNGIRSLTYGGGLWVIAGQAAVLATSPDTITWTGRSSGHAGTPINSLGYGNGVYLSGGEYGAFFTSTNAISWTSRSVGFGGSNVAGIIYEDSIYVAISGGGAVATSPDGITWTGRTSGFGGSGINAITYGDSLFVIAGSAGKLATSPDAITWTLQTSGFGADSINALVFNSGFYAGGNNGKMTTSAFETIYLSLDLKSPLTTLS